MCCVCACVSVVYVRGHVGVFVRVTARELFVCD